MFVLLFQDMANLDRYMGIYTPAEKDAMLTQLEIDRKRLQKLIFSTNALVDRSIESREQRRREKMMESVPSLADKMKKTDLGLECTLYYDYHHTSDWREEWSVDGKIVREQRYFDGITSIIDHAKQTIVADGPSLSIDLYPAYTLVIDDTASKQALSSIRMCDCRKCQTNDEY